MIDRTGMDYEELREIQEKHLNHWWQIIRPEIFLPVRDYALAMNQEATDPTQKHRVYRGQDLIELFRTWPEINTTVYPPAPDSVEAGI